jgi:hypothetical protein
MLRARGRVLDQQIRELRSLLADGAKRVHRAEQALQTIRARIARLRSGPGRSRS